METNKQKYKEPREPKWFFENTDKPLAKQTKSEQQRESERQRVGGGRERERENPN